MSPALLEAAREVAADLALSILRDMPRDAVAEHLDEQDIPRDADLIDAVTALFERGDIDIRIDPSEEDR